MKMMLRGAAVIACLFTSALLPPSAIAASSGGDAGDGGGSDGGHPRPCPPAVPSEILDFTITDDAVIDLLTRTVTINGTVVCTAGVQYPVREDCALTPKPDATLMVLADQKWGNHEASNSPGTTIPLPGVCTGSEAPWSITFVSTTTGDFKTGINAVIQATVYAFQATDEVDATLAFHPSNP
jgi:hypothetical protein